MGFLRFRKSSGLHTGQSQAAAKTRNDECPYCGQHLEQRPTRKKKCPHCLQFIYVRKPFLMTEREALLTDWAQRLEGLDVSRAHIDRDDADLKKQFGFDPPVNDVIWRTLNSLVAKTPGSHQARMAYVEMAQIARSEGRKPLPYLAEAARLELLEIQSSGIAKSVKIMTVNDQLVCPKCRALERRKIPLEEALETLPVPNDCESESGCRCWYAAELDD